MKTLLFGTVAVLALATAPALAQPAPPTPPGVAPGTTPPVPRLATAAPPHEMRMRMRVMSDRVMTRDEVIRHVHELFAKLDTNHDGFVTREEVEAFHARMEEMRGDTPGRNGEQAKMGGAMAERFPGHRMAMPDRARIFDKLDTNHDGVISRQEFMAAKTELHERRTMVIERDASAAASPPAANPVPGQPDMMMRMHAMHRMEGHDMEGHGMAMHAGMHFGGHLFEMADVNHDGRISLQEAEAAALAQFDKADLNHDGKITPEEREQAHALRREHRTN